MTLTPNRISSGVPQLDRLLGGLFIGDNVLWYDDAGSLAQAFSLRFIQASQSESAPLIYVSFDRSPKNLLEFLGRLAESRDLTILDCFTNGKGDGSDVFNQFYEKNGARWPYSIIKVNEPRKPVKVMESIQGIHENLKGNVRFVFESLTGMQDLWGGEDPLIKFYTHSCPKLYELNTIAYWIIEKGAHSDRLKAHINQIAQVAIDLAILQGKSALTIVKAERRNFDSLNKPHPYRTKGEEIRFDSDRRTAAPDLGFRLRELRTRQGLSQTELAKTVGVTPSTISQIEGNIISPSLSALIKIAETLSVDIASFFHAADQNPRLVFSSETAADVTFPELPKGSITGKRLTPADMDPKAEPYLIELPGNTALSGHFFFHKGEELGYVLSGAPEMEIKKGTHPLKAGDVIYLFSDIPSGWRNPGPETARLFWLKIR